MEVIRRMQSPDGSLELIVVRTGEVTAIGFEGHGWHVHPDTVRDVWYHADEPSSDQAVTDRFLSEVRGDRLPIALRRAGGIVVDAWVCDEATMESEVRDPEIELRLWSGRPWPTDERRTT